MNKVASSNIGVAGKYPTKNEMLNKVGSSNVCVLWLIGVLRVLTPNYTRETTERLLQQI